MEIRVGIAWQVVIDGQIDTLDIDTAAEDISGDADTLGKISELGIAFDTKSYQLGSSQGNRRAYRSSWLTPEWTAILGKLHSRRILSSSVARRVLFTKMMT